MSIAGWLPPEWARTILPIARRIGENQYTPIGTGFLISLSGISCFVTAKHVIFDNAVQRPELFILNNLLAGGFAAKECDALNEGQGLRWISHPTNDIVATILPAQEGVDDIRYFLTDMFEDFGNILEGDDVFYLGFPLGIIAPNRVTPVVRSGIIALKKDDHTFLIEANAFPGNSGSPVFFKPCPFQRVGTTLSLGRIRPPLLLGLVIDYVPYQDVATSAQTGRPRIIFEENSGLATVLSTRYIREVLDSPRFQELVQTVPRQEDTSTAQ